MLEWSVDRHRFHSALLAMYVAVRHCLYNVNCVSLYSGLINHWPILLYCTYYRIFRTLIVRLVITPIQGLDGKSVSSVLFVRTRLVNLYSYNNQQQPCIQMHWRYQYRSICIYTESPVLPTTDDWWSTIALFTRTLTSVTQNQNQNIF
jgi:hypothetical protein